MFTPDLSDTELPRGEVWYAYVLPTLEKRAGSESSLTVLTRGNHRLPQGSLTKPTETFRRTRYFWVRTRTSMEPLRRSVHGERVYRLGWGLHA